MLDGPRAGALSSVPLPPERMAVALRVERGDGIMDGAVEVLWASEGLVGRMVPLQVAPEGLDGVQLRSACRADPRRTLWNTRGGRPMVHSMVIEFRRSGTPV